MSGSTTTSSNSGPLAAAVATAARGLFDNPAPSGLATPEGWAAENAALYTVLSSLTIIVLFAGIALIQYRRISRR